LLLAAGRCALRCLALWLAALTERYSSVLWRFLREFSLLHSWGLFWEVKVFPGTRVSNGERLGHRSLGFATFWGR
jgi:hypothetical protein